MKSDLSKKKVIGQDMKWDSKTYPLLWNEYEAIFGCNCLVFVYYWTSPARNHLLTTHKNKPFFYSCQEPSPILTNFCSNNTLFGEMVFGFQKNNGFGLNIQNILKIR